MPITITSSVIPPLAAATLPSWASAAEVGTAAATARASADRFRFDFMVLSPFDDKSFILALNIIVTIDLWYTAKCTINTNVTGVNSTGTFYF